MNRSTASRPIKLLWVLPSLEGGGAERAIVTILKQLDRQRVEPMLCLFYKKGTFLKEVEAAGIPIFSLENGRFSPTNLYKLTQLIRQQNPDVTIGVLRRCSMLTALAHKLSSNQGQLFINEQNIPSIEMKQFGYFYLKRLGYRPFLRMADGVLVISEGIRADLVQHFQVPAHKIKLIPNPIEIQTVQEKAKRPVNHRWIKAGFKTIVSVGRLHLQKGHDILIEAFGQVKTAVPQAKLIIVGTGPEKESLLAQIKQQGLEDAVNLVGFQENPYPFMAKAELFVLASRYEGFGIVLAEALALNTAVIATNCPSGPADILAHGKAGTLVQSESPPQLAQKIIDYFDNPNSFNAQKEQALIHVQQYRATAVADQYTKLFSLIKGG